ncbi:ABC transporter substrate-binding protein [Streptomyces litchfieldiae]|uniref:ABC transporter substrate-binding protein n=1 Tax=Streptomyces litchfieldiae TaxID=3075543 RepID=A0ABU2MW69_9ACTN|nr:ABC transporter substrate-binding protein [Streptomyces sp. DSM 44938]MDT0345553.1 ABC transporter substrate-binding protein [Streptomyces sp. DSM 44938]
MSPSRRSLLAAGGALGAGALLAACGDESDDNEGANADGDAQGQPGGGGWSFTDDRGETVELDAAPSNIVAFVSSAAALHDYGIECVGIFGPSSPVDGEPNPQAGDLDVSRLTSVGEAWGEFSIEKYAQLEPDLLISNMFPPPDLWFVPEEARDEIFGLAPAIGITGARVSLLEPIARYAELAEALGADLSATAVTEARSRFEAAAESLRRAARDNPGIKVMAVSADDENLYVAVPDSYTDLHYFKDLGVGVVEGRQVDEWGFWEFLSWENADKYHADIILLDNRAQALRPEDLARKPTWARLPAVAAGRVVPWSMEERYSHAGYAPILEQLSDTISNAEQLG